MTIRSIWHELKSCVICSEPTPNVLRTHLVTIKHDLHAARDDFHKEHGRLLDLAANQKRLLESEDCKSNLVLERGEMASAQAVLAAQQRAKCRAASQPC